jgi:hypothetical protein
MNNSAVYCVHAIHWQQKSTNIIALSAGSCLLKVIDAMLHTWLYFKGFIFGTLLQHRNRLRPSHHRLGHHPDRLAHLGYFDGKYPT